MNARQNAKSVSSIEQQIQSIHLSQQERNRVLHQARIAEALVEVFFWVGGKFNRPGAQVSARLSPKY